MRYIHVLHTCIYNLIHIFGCSLEYAYEPMDSFLKRDLVTDFYEREAGTVGGEKKKQKPVQECAYGVLGLPKGALAAQVGHLDISTHRHDFSWSLSIVLYLACSSAGFDFHMSFNHKNI